MVFILATVLTGLLIVLAGVVEWNRDPQDGGSGFTIAVGIVAVVMIVVLTRDAEIAMCAEIKAQLPTCDLP